MILEKKHKPWQATIFTLYPEMFPATLGYALHGKALAEDIWKLETINLRNYGHGKHRAVDDTPAGGGAGMVLRADVVDTAIKANINQEDKRKKWLMSPRGRPFSQSQAQTLAQEEGLIIICGRFEGVDERVIEKNQLEEVSIGDYVLAGGETAALVILEASIRLLHGVMGNETSADQESFSHPLLEHPQYTRPREWQGLEIPEVLLSGDHARIASWRLQEAEKLTQIRRPDLWQEYQAQKKRPTR